MSNVALRSGMPSEHNRPSTPDEPIGYSILNRSRQRGASRHFGFFQYPAKKPWSVVQEYIKHPTVTSDAREDWEQALDTRLVAAFLLPHSSSATSCRTKKSRLLPGRSQLLLPSYTRERRPDTVGRPLGLVRPIAVKFRGHSLIIM